MSATSTIARIEVYPSVLPGEPLERHETACATLHEWMTAKVPAYAEGAAQPVSAAIGGTIIPPEEWATRSIVGCTVEIRPHAREPITGFIALYGVYIAAAVAVIGALYAGQMAKKMGKGRGGGATGADIESASLSANQPKLNSIIPEIAGRHKTFPDYLNQPRRYFVTPTKQALDVLLCIGRGEYQIEDDDILIGETRLNDLGESVAYTIFAPGASVAGHQAHRCWYNAPEVGSSVNSAGLRLIASAVAGESEGGTPSTLTGSTASGIDYSSPNEASFSVWGEPINLSILFANVAAVVASIQAQVPGLIVSETAGVIRFTERYPYLAAAITVAGDYTTVLGTPVSVAGTATRGAWTGPFRATPANETTSTLEIDILAPNGLGSIDANGNISSSSRDIEVEWTSPSASGTELITMTAASRDQIGKTTTITLPSPMAYVDVRVRRNSLENTSVSALDRFEWYGMRTRLVTPTSYAGVTTMAVTMEGSDVIAARTENRLNMIVTRKLGGVPTRSIEAWVRYVAESIGYAPEDVDDEELTRLGVIWDGRGDYFDLPVTDQTTVREALGDALNAGFAELTIAEGMIRPVRDEPRTEFEHMYTPQAMTEPLSRQFSAIDADEPDGVDVEYLDGATYEKQVIQCRLPGDVGVRIRKITVPGVTNATKAYRLGMRQRRLQKYRRKTFSFSTELDALNSRYLSYAAISDDVPGYGQSSLLRSATPISGGYLIESTEALLWVDGASHVMALRRPDGTLAGPYAVTRAGDKATLIAALDFTPTSDGEPTHLLFGISTAWCYPVLVTSITPSGDGASVVAVNYDERVYADDDLEPTP